MSSVFTEGWVFPLSIAVTLFMEGVIRTEHLGWEKIKSALVLSSAYGF